MRTSDTVFLMVRNEFRSSEFVIHYIVRQIRFIFLSSKFYDKFTRLKRKLKFPGNEGNEFEIKSNGEIWSTRELDRETKAEYRLAVVAEDGGKKQRKGETVVVVKILDEDDNPPRFTNIFNSNVKEDIPVGICMTFLLIQVLKLILTKFREKIISLSSILVNFPILAMKISSVT